MEENIKLSEAAKRQLEIAIQQYKQRLSGKQLCYHHHKVIDIVLKSPHLAVCASAVAWGIQDNSIVASAAAYLSANELNRVVNYPADRLIGQA